MFRETFQQLLGSSQHSLDDDADNFYNSSISDGCYDISLDDRQGFLCHKLHRELQQEMQQERRHRNNVNLEVNENLDPNTTDGNKEVKSTMSSIRMLFPDTRVADLLPGVITPLLNARVETQQLLPTTQDFDANEEVLDNKAVCSFVETSGGSGKWTG
jgi:hypothetical protein